MIRWGLVGCGDVAEHKGGPGLIDADGSRLVAVASRNERRAADFAKRHGAERHYTTLEALLSDDEVDAVYVATPPHVHAEQTVTCARAGKHILCEKPMALTNAECDQMIRAADEGGVQLMVAYYRRRYPAVMKIKELLEAGRIGRPTVLRAQMAGRYQPPVDGVQPWRTDPAIAGGGFLWDVGSHRIDLMIHFLGDVAEVSAFVDTVAFDLDVDDSASVLLRQADGAQGVGIFHWNVGRGGDEIEIGGTEGRIVCDMATGCVRLIAAAGQEQWMLPPPKVTHRGIVEDLVQAIETGRQNCLPGDEGRKTNAVLAAAVESSRDGSVVRLS